jgi:hypothetical protein
LVSFAVFGIHKPWWPYYYVHTAIPMTWCAVIGALWPSRRIKHYKSRIALVALALFGISSLSWMVGRLYLQVVDLRRCSRTYSSPVIRQMQRFKPFTEWVYADNLAYSFHAGIPMVPSLAVVPVKRLWSGEMTNSRIVAELAKYEPGLVLLRNDGRQVPFIDLLQTEYQLVYIDSDSRLFARRNIAKKVQSVSSR